MKYSKIINQLLTGNTPSGNIYSDLNEIDCKIIEDVNVIVSNHYKAKIEINTILHNDSLNKKDKEIKDRDTMIKAYKSGQLMDRYQNQRELDEKTIKELKQELADKEKAYQDSLNKLNEVNINLIKGLLSDKKYSFGLIVKPL